MTRYVQPKRPASERFLFAAYWSRRTEEMELRDWSAAHREDVVRRQFNLRHQHCLFQFPNVETHILEENEKTIPRTILNRTDGEIRYMGFARLPEHRSRSMGTNPIPLYRGFFPSKS